MSLSSVTDASDRRLRLDLAVIIPMLTKYGGAERYLIECVRHWQRRHDITIYSAAVNRALLTEHGIDPEIKCLALTPYFEGEHAMLLNAVLLPQIWRDEIGKHDLYHTHLWPTHLIDLHPMVWFPHEPFRASRDLRYEQSVDFADDVALNMHLYPKFNYDRLVQEPIEPTLNAIERMNRTATPERIVANSRYTAHYLEDVYERPVTDVVYPGASDFSIDLPVNSNLFVTVSQLWSHKRINLLIEAIALTDDTQLIVVGTGPERERLEMLTERLGLADRIFFLSDLTNFELQLVLARACAFLYGALNEPFGIAVLEAMAAGKPVIAVKQGGYVEVCSPDFAMLLPPFPSAFAEKISELQRAPDVAKRMGLAARSAARKYTWERTANELEALLLKTREASYVPPSKAHSERSAGPLVGIQYYAWYGDGFGTEHWCDSRSSGYVRDKPLLGYYSSIKEQTIAFHIDLIERMGLDFTVINLHVDDRGTNKMELIGARHIFEIARKRKSRLRFALQIAPYTVNADELEEAIQTVKTVFVSQPNYFHLDDSPALFWFWPTVSDGDATLIERINVATKGLTNIALSLRLPQFPGEERLTFGLFRGFAPFSPLELSGESGWQKVWTEAYRRAEQTGMDYRIATISPGYDDRDLDDDARADNPYRLVPRNDGETYRRAMAVVDGLTPKPDLVIVSTFNEYHENTHIEPSLANGMRYCDMTGEFIKRLKATRGPLDG